MKDKQKQEAIKRMKLLHIMPQVIKDFEKKGEVYYSERQSKIFPATLYWLSNNQEYVAMVKEFEEETNSLVYHCQLTHTIMGDMLSLLYVSENEEEWEMDKENIATENVAFVMVKNLDDDECSEYGYIGIKSCYGGVARTY